ncbi:MAG: GuaB3 family IMP dehydrogenase-related protein [Dehalococcoidia bacterium]|nr:GuaB3 family IMP dehydrogenase-related protein [Dehalococcoidia bacterium]
MASHEHRSLRYAYGFDDVAIAPGDVTLNPDQTDLSLKFGEITFNIPILAAAMDGVVDPGFAILFSKFGGLAVLNLEGVHSRYENPDEVLARIAAAPDQEVTPLLQKIYSAPLKEELVAKCIRRIKAAGATCAVSVTPASTKKLAPVIVEAGADILVVQSTVTTARHLSKSYRGLIFSELCSSVPIPVVVGNCVSYEAAYELMETGIAGLLVGVGPGAACTTREVLGVGVPQVTATMDVAAARDDYFRASGRYVSVITDGGMTHSGDICKAIAAGADGVMLGSIMAQAKEAPGHGYHWGMATPHPGLPRGTRVKVGISGSLEQILFGPSSVTGGTHNLVGAIRTGMGMCGAPTIRDMQKANLLIAPAIKTEGKVFQMRQQSGKS